MQYWEMQWWKLKVDNIDQQCLFYKSTCAVNWVQLEKNAGIYTVAFPWPISWKKQDATMKNLLYEVAYTKVLYQRYGSSNPMWRIKQCLALL